MSAATRLSPYRPCVLAVTASWSVRVYVPARETHGRGVSSLLPVTCYRSSFHTTDALVKMHS